MRMFLPIKGPGGRYLTPNEKIALLILGLTLVLGVLTLLAGEAAYLDDGAQNPIFGFVAVLCRGIGGGIIALYALVLVWSGLIYFKGERVADVAPLGGRMFAALAVTVGVSGALGIAQLESAGRLGSLVGGALDHTLGGAVGFPVLLMLMLLGFHLAGQGAWTALREPMALATATATPSPHAAFGYGLSDPVEHRLVQDPPMPDDGDPTADERSLAVKQAMEEIERSQGVTIVDVEPEIGVRPSIGEDVEAAPTPAPETEEAEVQSGLETVADALTTPVAADADEEEDEVTVEDRDDDAHGLVPVPPSEIATEDQEYDEEEEAEYEEEEEDGAEEEEDGEYEEYEDEAEYDEDEEYEDEDDAEDEDEEEAEYEEYEDEGEEEEQASAEDDEAEAEVEDAETGFAKAASAEEDDDAQADGFAEPESDDPYARGGLLRRMQRRQVPVEDTADDNRTYTTFDWRGRPLD
jgi:hypothetical protein